MIRRLKPRAMASNLRDLLLIRTLLLALIASAMLFAPRLGALVSADDVWMVWLMLAISTFFAWLRLLPDWPVTAVEFVLHLLIDILAITGILYLTGGPSNPFASFYLVPLCIAAAILPAAYAWSVALCCIAAYSLLFPVHEALPGLNALLLGDNLPQVHVVGMWLNFVLSALIITYFVVHMARAVQTQQQQLADRREDDLRDEQIMAVATLAAGTAHELGTPLATMTVLLDEMRDEHPGNGRLATDIDTLANQVRQCRKILTSLVSTADQGVARRKQRVRVDHFITDLVERWRIVRPDVTARVVIDGRGDPPSISVDTTVEQALVNVLNNAADASPDNVEIDLDWNPKRIVFDVADRGSGIPMAIAEELGRPFITTKGSGLGLGLFLSHATINRLGGEVALFNREDGRGARTRITLPINHGSSDDE